MGNASRKARKAAGEQFERAPKQGTPWFMRVGLQAHNIFSPTKTASVRYGLSNKQKQAIKDRSNDEPV